MVNAIAASCLGLAVLLSPHISDAFVPHKLHSSMHHGWAFSESTTSTTSSLAAAPKSDTDSNNKPNSSAFSGTFRVFADHAWKELEGLTNLVEPISLPDEFAANVVPAKAPPNHLVRLSARALRGVDAQSPIRYARMALIETVPMTTSDDKDDSKTDKITTAGVQVLNLVVFPSLQSNLPVWGADFVSLPGDKRLVLLDAQPMTLNASYEHVFDEWHQKRVIDKFSWGGDMPAEVESFVSSKALWTRFADDKDGSPLEMIQGPLLDAFDEHLKLYLELLKSTTIETAESTSNNEQANYIRYRIKNDPARPMLKSLFGEEYTENILHDVLFPSLEDTITKSKTTESAGKNFFAEIARGRTAEKEANVAPPAPVSNEPRTKIYVSGLPWKASQSEVIQHFSVHGQIISCNLPPSNDGRTVGIAIIEYADEEGAAQALQMDGNDYFGEGTLHVKYHTAVTDRNQILSSSVLNPVEPFKATKKASYPNNVEKEIMEAATRIRVSGLPWKASQQDVMAHFKTFGEIIKSGLILTRDGIASGEAFVQFATRESAIEALQMDGTDYYGEGRLRVTYSGSLDAPATPKSTDNERKDGTSSTDQVPVKETLKPSDSVATKKKKEPDDELAKAYEVVSQWDEIYKAIEGDREEVTEMQTRLKTLETENRALQIDLKRTGEVISQWEQKYKEMEKARDELAGKYDLLESEKASVAKTSASDIDLVTKIEKQLKMVETERDDLRNQLEVVGKAKLELERNMTIASDALADMRSNVKTSDGSLDKMHKAIELLRKENVQLKAELKTAGRVLLEQKGKPKAKKDDIDDVRTRLEALEEEKATLKSELLLAGEAVVKWQERFLVAEEGRDALSIQLESIKEGQTDVAGTTNSPVSRRDSSSDKTSQRVQDYLSQDKGTQPPFDELSDISAELEARIQFLEQKLEREKSEAQRQEKEWAPAGEYGTEPLDELSDFSSELEARINFLEEKLARDRMQTDIQQRQERKEAARGVQQRPGEYLDAEIIGATSILVSGVPWKASRQEVLQYFKDFGDVVSCVLPTKHDGSTTGTANIQFASAASAARAVQVGGAGFFGDGVLKVKYDTTAPRQEARPFVGVPRQGAQQQQYRQVDNRNYQSHAFTKIHVRGLPWRASQQEIYEYFLPFGQIVACKVDPQGDGRSAGDCIIEFERPEAAAQAMRLNGSDFFGQGRLTIDVADDPMSRQNGAPPGRNGAPPGRNRGPPGPGQPDSRPGFDGSWYS